MGKCKVCGKNAESDYCFQHKPRKGFKAIRVGGRQRPKFYASKEGMEAYDKAMEAHLMKEFFMKIWKKRSHTSEVSGEYLGKRASTAYFHHILPKSKYPELAYKEDNIILLTLNEHANVESDMYRYEEVNQRREKLITKYLNQEDE